MIADFFVEILTGATEMLSALGTVVTDALDLFYSAGAVTPLGQLVLAIGGIALAYGVVNWILSFVKSIGARASRTRK